jgi:predicted unusual protein kinase regulating ubiquinone biosynthesis (AarF/ABC1/UbiB family)
MDYLPGAAIETLESAEQPRRDACATALIALFLRELFEWRQVQTDPNFANYRLCAGDRIGLLDYGAAREIPAPLAAQFRALLQAVAAGETEAVRHALHAIGYMRPETPAAQQATILALAALITPTLSAERFDFGDTRVLEAARRLGQRLALEQGFAEVPPVPALLLLRKLAGLVMLATRLRARVPMAALVAPYRAPGAADRGTDRP